MSLWSQTVGACFPAPIGDPSLPISVAETGGRRGSEYLDKRRFTLRRLLVSYWTDWVLIVFLW